MKALEIYKLQIKLIKDTLASQNIIFMSHNKSLKYLYLIFSKLDALSVKKLTKVLYESLI